MKLKVAGSSSKGNCYILENETSALIIEAGVSPKTVKAMINYEVSKIAGVLISHSHGDHSKYGKQWQKMGIPIYCSSACAESLSISGHNYVSIEGKEKLHVGPWQVMPFDLIHDVPCFGFLLFHKETGLMPFITDTHYCPYKFPGMNNLMIECNYDEDILEDMIIAGKTHPVLRNRVLGSHISISSCEAFLDAHDTKTLNQIILMHLSSSHSDAKAFKERIEGRYGVMTHIAESGLTININKGI